MIGPFGDDVQVQLIAVDHQGLFETVLYAYRKVATKGADRAILHRAALAPGYRADPDEINRLREAQRRLAELEGQESMVAELEQRIAIEHGEGRSASALAKLSLAEVRDAAIRWSVIGKRGAPVRVSPELIGVLQRLLPDGADEDGFPACLSGDEEPEDHAGEAVFPPGDRLPYRGPGSVQALCDQLDAIDRPTLDAAITEVVGNGPGAEETATWVEEDVENLTNLYRRAAAQGAGIWYRGA